ncbi:hypothetical protein V1520DRAFT_360320 [Lipomyces starkeyi]
MRLYCLYASETESLSTLVSSHWKSGLKETMGSPVRDVYNRTYDNFRENKSPSARFIETLRDEDYIYSVKLCTDSTLAALFFCNPDDVQRARLYGQTVIIDATYKTNKFRLPLVNFVAVDNNLRIVRVALCLLPASTQVRTPGP